MVDFNKLRLRTPEERQAMRDSLDAEIKARDMRVKMMIDKLYDQMSCGCIDNSWVENFIESVHSQYGAGLPLSDKQLVKIEELFERY